MKVSIIIPTYCEAEQINLLIKHLYKHADGSLLEIIVSDGGSKDDTLKIVEAQGAKAILSPKKGRASQMNYGAQVSKGDILYFVHADSFPPPSYLRDIREAAEQGFSYGNFGLTLNSDNPLVQWNCTLTRKKRMWTQGGDQTLFVKRSFFEDVGAYNESMCIMEEYEWFERAMAKEDFVIIQKDVDVVNRKYPFNSYLRVNIANATAYLGYKMGVPNNALYKLYKLMIKGPRY